MEESHSQVLFPPHRRSHLRSHTYRTLLRIVSPFSAGAHPTPACSSHLKQATVELSGQQVGEDFARPEIGDSALEKATGVENEGKMDLIEDLVIVGRSDNASDDRELLGASSQDGLGMNSLEGRRVRDSEGKMDVIEDSVIVGRSDDASDDRELLGASFHEESRRDKLEAEHMVQGNKVLVDDSSSNKMGISDQTNRGNDQISSTKFQEEIAEDQQVLAEKDSVSIVHKLSVTIFSLDSDTIEEASKCKEDNQENIVPIENQPNKSKPDEGLVCEPDIERERSHVSSFELMEVEVEVGKLCSEKVSEADLSYLDKEMPCRACEQSKNIEDKALSMEVDASGVEEKMLSNDVEMDKCSNENEDIEEGEIFGDSTQEVSEDPAVLDEKVVDIQIFEGTVNRNELSIVQANGESKKPDSLFSSVIDATPENREKSKQNKSSLIARKHGSIDPVKMMRSTIEDRNDFMSEEPGYIVKDGGPNKDLDSFTAHVSNQVLHGHVLSERATGRKETVSKEKRKRGPGSEGRKEKKKAQKRKKRAEKNRQPGVKRLKLHPVTVPKPVVYCRHYMKGRCQEGDKCKFSHDTIPLTKSSPCVYFARHLCMKGDDCPFDHQLFKYPCSNFVSKGSCARGDTCMFSHKILPKEQSTTPNLKIESKSPVISDGLDSQKKLNISSGIKQKLVTVPNYAGASWNTIPQGGSLLKKTTGSLPSGISFLSFGKSPDHSSQAKNDEVECRNSSARKGLCSVDNSTENLRKIQPESAPKGINFLSFGRNSLKSNNETVATPSSYNDSTIPSSNQTLAVSKIDHGSNELLNRVQTTAPKPTNFSSPIGNYTSNELVSLSSSSKGGSNVSLQIKGSMHDNKPEGLSALLSRLPGTSITSGQSSGSIASGMNKGTSNSAQKALLSTLAFAAKFESMNKDKCSASAGSSDGNKEDKNSGSLKNDQAKASKLLDFLLGIGYKSNLK